MVLKSDGWPGFYSVFEKPPANTQQIMHPELYRSGTVPKPLKLGLPDNFLDENWTLLEQNSMGEFGWKEVFRQFLQDDRAKQLAAAWDGDVYATFEQKGTKKTLLVTRIRLSSEETAARFFGQYSEALEKKHAGRSDLLRQPNFFSFSTPDGGVFLRCSKDECVTLEGGDRTLFLKWIKSLGWITFPDDPNKSDTTVRTTKL
jgi:hypothetical protein